MTLDGFYYGFMTLFGSATFTRQFNMGSPVNLMAFGNLGAVEISGGSGLAYVGIQEITLIDPGTGRPINRSTQIGGQPFPQPGLFEQKVTAVVFAFGSTVPPGNHAQYANANLNIFLWE